MSGSNFHYKHATLIWPGGIPCRIVVVIAREALSFLPESLNAPHSHSQAELFAPLTLRKTRNGVSSPFTQR